VVGGGRFFGPNFEEDLLVSSYMKTSGGSQNAEYTMRELFLTETTADRRTVEGQPEPYIVKTEQRVQKRRRKKGEDQTQLVKEERKTSTSTSITSSSRE